MTPPSENRRVAEAYLRMCVRELHVILRETVSVRVMREQFLWGASSLASSLINVNSADGLTAARVIQEISQVMVSASEFNATIHKLEEVAAPIGLSAIRTWAGVGS